MRMLCFKASWQCFAYPYSHLQVEEVIESSVSGESRRGGEDKVLDDLEKVRGDLDWLGGIVRPVRCG